MSGKDAHDVTLPEHPLIGMSGHGARQSLAPACSRSIHAAPGPTVTELLVGLSGAAHRPAHRRPGGVVHPAQLRPRRAAVPAVAGAGETGAQAHNAVSGDAEGAATVAGVLLVASAGMEVWVGTAAAGAPLGLGAALAGALNVTPVALLCLGAAVLALSWVPRAVLAVGALPAVSGFLLQVVAQSVGAPEWIDRLSPFRAPGLGPPRCHRTGG